MRVRETETRICEGGFVPFSQPRAIGGFLEMWAPCAFTKTLREQREIAARVGREGARFGRGPLTIAFDVIRDRWAVTYVGALRRELLEVRILSVTEGAGCAHVSNQARAIATGVKRQINSSLKRKINEHAK